MIDFELDDLDVSRETNEKLNEYLQLLQKWTKKINLISSSTDHEVWSRHIADSAQIYSHAPNDWMSWIDLGSGGGLPGLIVAIMDPQNRPVRLVESDTRKCVFLKTAARDLSLNVAVISERIEDLTIQPCDVLSARALADLPTLLGYANMLLASDGQALFPKGRQYKEELELARQSWHFDVELLLSRTSIESAILKITKVRPRGS